MRFGSSISVLPWHAPADLSGAEVSSKRTFLGDMGMSSSLALIRGLFTQLSPLQRRESDVGYPYIGSPLSVRCCASTIRLFLSWVCYAWEYQQILIQGYALSGGF
ncbi:hypothetical protein F4805DRAFT_434525 [Annulohypoxylon moriforme]|nr:hypothetical protein F4805DRAFT_434525 [Annulohypoxylon moriforme]